MWNSKNISQSEQERDREREREREKKKSKKNKQIDRQIGDYKGMSGYSNGYLKIFGPNPGGLTPKVGSTEHWAPRGRCVTPLDQPIHSWRYLISSMY